MARPTLTPASQTNAITLPSSSLPSEAESADFPFSVYTDNEYFLSGAAQQVAYTYKKLGGDVLDVEITKEQVYSAYQESVLEYSYIVNIHQAKNSLSDLLGANTGSFNEEGQLQSGDTLSGSNVELKFPKFRFEHARRVAYGYATEAGIGGQTPIYSASFTTVENQQDYDLQEIVSSSAATDTSLGFYGKVGNKRIVVTRVFYKTPQAMWRFYGYYGGLNVVGNLASYGQYADDSTFQLVPVWQNKAQSMAFEDAIYTRNSHYSYEIKDNKLRIFPETVTVSPTKMYINFYVDSRTPWEEDREDRQTGIGGINNMNTLPFENIPYGSINSIGKQWIRRYTLALCKEILGNIRNKFTSIPIPGDNVTLNGSDMVTQGKEEQEKLKEELKTVLDELTYTKVAQMGAELTEAVNKIQERIPLVVFTG